MYLGDTPMTDGESDNGSGRCMQTVISELVCKDEKKTADSLGKQTVEEASNHDIFFL